MKKKLFATSLLMFGLVPALVGCGGDPTPTPTPKYPESIVLNKEEATLLYSEGASTQESVVLTATVTPSDYSQGKITWGGGKSYDTTYVTLTPSADGKSCTVTAAKVCTDGVEVYAQIMGESAELTARCTVYVNAPKVHATAIEFKDASARNATLKNVVFLEYTMTPAVNDDLVQCTSTNENVATGYPITSKGYVQVTPKTPGTTTLKIAAYDGETKKCESSQSVTITVSDALDISVEPGETTKSSFSDLNTSESAWNVFKFSLKNNVQISKANPMKITVTPKDATDVDTDKVSCFVGMVEKGSSNWIIYTGQGEASCGVYKNDYPETLVAGKVYYIQLQNRKELASSSYDVHVELPEA